jgi:hypothetical protein
MPRTILHILLDILFPAGNSGIEALGADADLPTEAEGRGEGFMKAGQLGESARFRWEEEGELWRRREVPVK